MNFDNAVSKLDAVLGVVFKYELHAFVIMLTGLSAYLHGAKDIGTTIIGSALLIFKGKS